MNAAATIAPAPQHLRALARANEVRLARGDLHDTHGVADHVGGALLALRSGGHSVLVRRQMLKPK